jgi:hypothetical protein
MLCGRLLPELGGSRQHLDIIGINYYWMNQWEWGNGRIPLDEADPRRTTLRQLVRSAWERYGGELMITETSHVDERRACWLRSVAEEVGSLLDERIPLHGLCLYPILGMPEWHARHQWTQMGLWNLEARDGRLERVPHLPMMEALDEVRFLMSERLRQRPITADCGSD